MGNIALRLTPCADGPAPDTTQHQRAPQNPNPTNAKTPAMPMNGSSILRQPSFRTGGNSSAQQLAFDTKYELLNTIGTGSSGVVRRVRERGGQRREFACKIIDKKKVGPQFNPVMEQFQNEIDVLMRLQQTARHPNIIHLEDVYITNSVIYMIMEYMRGGELFDYVVERGTLSEEEASTMIRKVTSAVAHMHSQGIIHRDLKPENLLLTRNGAGAEIKIIDFGLSKMLPVESTQTTQSFLGTRGYLAPEMLKRQAYAASVDVWALGVIAFILLCGCLPFDDDSAPITDADAKAKFQLRFPHWAQNISADAKDFLTKLLEGDAKARITAEAALDHPWLNDVVDEALTPEAEATTAQKKKLLSSPKHMRNVPRTPKRGTPNGGNGNGNGGNGGGGDGYSWGGGNGSDNGSSGNYNMPPVREAAGAVDPNDRFGQGSGIGAAVGAPRPRGGSF